MSRKFERAYFCNNIHPRISMQNVREMRAAQKADACHQNSKVTINRQLRDILLFSMVLFLLGHIFAPLTSSTQKAFLQKNLFEQIQLFKNSISL